MELPFVVASNKLGPSRRAVMSLLARLRRPVRLAAAVGFGSLPGFALPIVAVAYVSPMQSDLLLLGVAIAVIVATIVSSTFEASYVAKMSRASAEREIPEARRMARTSCVGAIVSMGLSLVLFPLMAIVLNAAGTGSSDGIESLAPLLPLVVTPAIASGSAVYSAFLIVHQRLPVLYLSVALRSVPTIFVVVVTSDVLASCLAYAVGELARYVWLSSEVRRMRVLSLQSGWRTSDKTLRVTAGELFHLMLSMFIGQSGPLMVRAIFVSGPVGSVTSGEFANRIYSGASQITSSVFVMPRVGGIGVGTNISGEVERVGFVRAQLSKVFLSGSVVSGCCIIIAVIGRNFLSLNEYLDQGLLWSCVLVTAIPFLAVNSLASRVIVLCGKARNLTLISAASAVILLITGFGLVSSIGPFAGIVAAALGQVSSGLLAALVALRAARSFDAFASTAS